MRKSPPAELGSERSPPLSHYFLRLVKESASLLAGSWWYRVKTENVSQWARFVNLFLVSSNGSEQKLQLQPKTKVGIHKITFTETSLRRCRCHGVGKVRFIRRQMLCKGIEDLFDPELRNSPIWRTIRYANGHIWKLKQTLP